MDFWLSVNRRSFGNMFVVLVVLNKSSQGTEVVDGRGQGLEGSGQSWAENYKNEGKWEDEYMKENHLKGFLESECVQISREEA